MESRDEFNFFLFLFEGLVCHLKNAEREMGKVEVLRVGIVVFFVPPDVLPLFSSGLVKCNSSYE